MAYYRGDYYRGDYYRGDFFGGLRKLGRAALGAVAGFATGGPVGAVIGGVSGFKIGPSTPSMPVASPPYKGTHPGHGVELPRVMIPKLITGLTNGKKPADFSGVVGGSDTTAPRVIMTPAGPMIAAGGRRRRSMNHLNPKALTRATRRVEGFVKKARKAVSQLGYTVVRRGSGRGKSSRKCK